MKIIYTWMIASLVAMSLSGCSGEAQAKITETEVTIPVEADIVRSHTMLKTYVTTTNLSTSGYADVVARTTGLVTHLYAEEGDIVQEGQILAQLDVQKLTLEVKRLEATLNKYKAEMKRQAQLYKRNLISLDAYETATFDYDAQQAQHDIAKLDLDRATIRSPIAGVVAVRNIKLGNMLTPNSKVFTVIDPNTLEARLHLPEGEYGKIVVGQVAILRANDVMVHGVVQRIAPLISSDSGTFAVTVGVSDSDMFRSGMFVRIAIILKEIPDAPVVKTEAIITQDSETFVYVIQDGVAIQKEITTGISYEGFTQVLTGLAKDDQVVVMGQRSLKHSAKITII